MTTHDSSPLATSSPRVETLTEGTMVLLWLPPPGFADITGILWRSQPPQTPLGPIEEQAPTAMVGSTLLMSQMIQDAWGNLSVDMMTCQLSVIGSVDMVTCQLSVICMGPTSTVTVRCPPQRHPQI